VNIGLVLGAKHALLVDTGSSPAQGATIAESVRNQFHRVIDRVVVTHAHYDHWFGLGAFNNVKTYGQAGLLDEMSVGVDTTLVAQLGFTPDLIAPPQNLILDWGSFSLGGEHVQLKYFGPAHSNSDLVVYVPGRRLAFVGDLLEEPGPPHFGPDTTVSTWPNVIDQVIALVGLDTLLVPGHGKPVDTAFALRQRNDIERCYRQIREWHTRGYGLQDALARIEMGCSLDWPFSVAAMREAAICIYAELAGSQPPTRPA
jgi:glyoxylase-like metal-dependent hydrolase (beta-lactamase superfamily II)